MRVVGGAARCHTLHPTSRGKESHRRRSRPFSRTDLSLSTDAILREYGDRWAVEIEIRDANAFDGLGQDQCRKRQRIIGANTFRLVMAAARTLWFLDQVEAGTGCESVPLSAVVQAEGGPQPTGCGVGLS